MHIDEIQLVQLLSPLYKFENQLSAFSTLANDGPWMMYALLFFWLKQVSSVRACTTNEVCLLCDSMCTKTQPDYIQSLMHKTFAYVKLTYQGGLKTVPYYCGFGVVIQT